MKKSVDIPEKYSDVVINIALDTISLNKQALVFVNTKRGAESQAERIALKIKEDNKDWQELSEKALKALTKPTKQCKRLALCMNKGIAFHHAGLASKQRELVEDNFRKGKVKIICCTPTLCISKGTKIWHGISETEVSKFKTSNPLFALSKTKLISMKSQKVQKIENSSKLIQISSVSGYSVKVTPNHKMLVKRKNKKMVLQAGNVKKSDKIATISRLNIKNTKNPSIKDFVVDRNVYLEQKFNPELSYFIGAMLGDGYSGAETIDGKIKYKGSPCLVGVDAEVFSNVKTVCEEMRVSCRKTKNSGGTPQLVLGKNNWFREFLLRCGVDKGENKHISEMLMTINLENTASLLRGLFDTDGFLEAKKGPGFSNTSEKLVKQIQKLLLRFGIVSTIRKRKGGTMKINEKEYKTKPHFELMIFQKGCIFDFYRFIGFNIQRKQEALINLIARISSNLNYVSCDECKYKIYKDLFSGRSKDHKIWGETKLKVIELLGERGELGSREIRRILGKEPRKGETRLNHHYQLIKKRRIGSRSNTERYWGLNPIGEWIFTNILDKNKNFIEFFKLRECPLCGEKLEWVIKKGWRDSDFEGDIFWDKIREIKEVEVEKDVYDVVLPNTPKNDHMFVANGFIVHNSYGLNLPSFRTVVRDLKRYGGPWGMHPIPVLEYHQMIGRSGRPDFNDKYGEAICIANSKGEAEQIKEHYLLGEPEEIYSKLAVEPVLRTYILSLIASEFVTTEKELKEFFDTTFYAHQFKDLTKLHRIIDKMLKLLEEWEFITSDASDKDFTSADKLGKGCLKATLLGHRVAELYLDPSTAFFIMTCLRRATQKILSEFSFLQMVTSCNEMRPLLSMRVADYDVVQEKTLKYSSSILEIEPSQFSEEYEDFLKSIKTAMFFQDWINEKDEEYLLETYNIRPGEIHVKLNLADWLLYSSEELAKLLKFHPLIKEIIKMRFRLKHGANEELLPLLKLRDVGRVRARMMFKNEIKDITGVKSVEYSKLANMLGKKVALSVKKQVGQDLRPEKVVVKTNKRKGQKNIKDF